MARAEPGDGGTCAVAGVLTNSVLLMTAHYAMVHVGAAQIALVQTLNPLLTALLAWPLLGERLRPLQWLGIGAGSSRRRAHRRPGRTRSPLELHGLLLTAGGVLGAVLRHLYFGRFCRGVPILEGTTVQLLAAAAACAAATAHVRDAARGVGRSSDRRCRVERGGGVPWAEWHSITSCWCAARWRAQPPTSIWYRAPRR